MKQSVRMKRLQRNQKRNAKQTKLSLVSLMDIFTILVFFLMLNASDVQVLQNDKTVSLPKSSADTAAKETLLLLVNQKHILLQGEKVTDVDTVLANQQDVISPLITALNNKAPQQTISETTELQETPIAKSITIMADQAMPYQLLKKLMQSCAQAGYTDIALAVEHKAPAFQSEGA